MNARSGICGIGIVLALTACRGGAPEVDANAGAPHMRPAAQGESSALYFTMTNPDSRPLVLYGVEIDVAGASSFHNSMDHNGMATMAKVDSVIVPAHGSVAFAERGLHVMATDLHTPITVGDTIVARLLIRPARVDTLRAAIRE